MHARHYLGSIYFFSRTKKQFYKNFMLDQNISCSSVHSLLIISSYLNENGNQYFLSDSSMGNRIVIIILMKLLTNIVCLRQTWWKWPFDIRIWYCIYTLYLRDNYLKLSWVEIHIIRQISLKFEILPLSVWAPLVILLCITR